MHEENWNWIWLGLELVDCANLVGLGLGCVGSGWYGMVWYGMASITGKGEWEFILYVFMYIYFI